MNQRTTLGLLLLIIGVHIALAAMFASVTPYRASGVLLSQRGSDGQPQSAKDIGAPDERQHVNYVMHLLQTGQFPVFAPGDPNLYESYQSHQPPVFYLLASGWTKLLGAEDLEDSTNGLKLRALNVVIGSITVAGVFFLGYWGFKSERIGLCAAAFAATLPMFVALSSAVSTDPLLICLCSWVLALAGSSVNEGWTTKRTLLIAVLVGLALITKTTALALLPTILVAIFLTKSARPSKTNLLASVAIVGLIVAPWWLRNLSLYHDPLALRAFNDAFKGSAQKSSIVGAIQATDPNANAELVYWKDWIGWWTARSLLGSFGYMDIWLNETGLPGGHAPNLIYRLFFAVLFISLVGWILSLQKQATAAKSMHLVNGIFLAIVVMLFLRFNSQYFQAQARYLLPALGPISIGIAVGVLHFTKDRTRFALPLLLGLFGLISIYSWSRLPEEFAKRTGLVPVGCLEPASTAPSKVTAS